MDSLFEDLQEGLQQAIDYESGNGPAKKVTYVISPITEYSSDEIKRLRQNAGMTQATFASDMGVSVKTVEAWERGRTHPTGPACRLMTMLSETDVPNMSFIKALNNA